MKIRMLGNSIRLRLSQGDINKLKESGKISETIHFPNGHRLTYSLSTTEELTITADFQETAIKTFIPENLLAEWVNTDRVGYEQDLVLSNADTLKILIEKDFKCLTDRAEDESDLFPHPRENDTVC